MFRMLWQSLPACYMQRETMLLGANCSAMRYELLRCAVYLRVLYFMNSPVAFYDWLRSVLQINAECGADGQVVHAF